MFTHHPHSAISHSIQPFTPSFAGTHVSAACLCAWPEPGKYTMALVQPKTMLLCNRHKVSFDVTICVHTYSSNGPVARSSLYSALLSKLSLERSVLVFSVGSGQCRVSSAAIRRELPFLAVSTRDTHATLGSLAQPLYTQRL